MHDWKRLIEIFLQKNTELNLSAIRDKDWVQLKHIQDSLKLLETWLFQPWKLVIDLWTGSGFPLMPLAISCPESQFLGIDSIKKKTVAVNEMLAQLNVQNAEVLWTRISEKRLILLLRERLHIVINCLNDRIRY